MTLHTAGYAEYRLYIGSVNMATKEQFTKRELVDAVARLQKEWEAARGYTHTVRVSECDYVCGDYEESGWELSVINYPRRRHDLPLIEQFCVELQSRLMAEFRQHRITVMADIPGSRIAFMAESEDAATK